MALKLSVFVSALTHVKDSINAVFKEKTPPWEGEQEIQPKPPEAVQSVAPSGSLVTSWGKKPVGCDHLWNPQTGKCVRCSTPKPVVSENAPLLVRSNLKFKVALPEQQVAPPLKALAPLRAPEKGRHSLPPTRTFPSPPEGSYTILTAIKELSEGRKGTLTLRKEATGVVYTVESVYQVTAEQAHVLLLGPDGLRIKPIVGYREVPQYLPVWR